MRRFEDWPKRLDAAIEAARAKPFCWGAHDCALFAADIVKAITGEDLASAWRETYCSALQATRALERDGGLISVANKALGNPVVPAQARRGDVVLRCGELGPSLGICLGAKCAFTGLDGLVFVPLRECEQAWHV